MVRMGSPGSTPVGLQALRSRAAVPRCWLVGTACARYGGIDGIAESEVGRWPGIRRRVEPPDRFGSGCPEAAPARCSKPPSGRAPPSPERSSQPYLDLGSRTSLDDRTGRSDVQTEPFLAGTAGPKAVAGQRRGDQLAEGTCARQLPKAHVRCSGGQRRWSRDGVRAGHGLSNQLSHQLCRHLMMWRPCIGRSRRSGRLSTGPIRSRLVSLIPHSAQPGRCQHARGAPAHAWDACLLAAPHVRVVWMKD
jgi:hypothetical protein